MAEERKMKRCSGSFRDPNGFVFRIDNQLYRQVSNLYQENLDLLHSSGLYRSLMEKDMIIPHEETPLEINIENTYKVIQPEEIPFISYPYEWCFSQLKDAAILTLKIQLEAIRKGMSLKDASAYNIQFLKGKPIFIDTLSFEKYDSKSPWVAYKQFCQHFLAPLALMSKAHIGTNKLLQSYIDGIPLDMASKLLPWKTKLSATLGVHIHLHAKSQRKHEANTDKTKLSELSFSEKKMTTLIKGLLIAIEKLTWKGGDTEWADYYENTHNYGEEGLVEKVKFIKSLIETVKPKTVWDFGANIGKFSQLACDYGAETVALDIDPSCVEWSYRQNKSSRSKTPLPVIYDLANPSPSIGWANEEREKLEQRGPVDLILALGLIHHLTISNNVPLHDVAKYFSRLSEYLIIEFVPKNDSQVELLLKTRKDVFLNYNVENFEQTFSRYFKVVSKGIIPGTKRTLFLLQSPFKE